MKQTRSRLSAFFLFGLCALLFCGAFAFLFVSRYLTAEYTPIVTGDSAVMLDNPYQGFYELNGFLLSEEQTANDAADWAEDVCSTTPYQLMLLEINLKEYARKSISDLALQQLGQILDQCTKAKKQVILRFLYDWEGNAQASEPTRLSRITDHVKQLAPVVNQYSDCIYIIQGTLTGNNGEMNHSRYQDVDDLREIMIALNSSMDTDIFLAVRTPAQLRGILHTPMPLSSSGSYLLSMQARVGLFNDGMLGSVYDLGTYDDTPLQDDSSLDEAGTREEELLYQEKLCLYVPNGGEVVIDNEYNDLQNAIADLAQMHVSYLNSQHDEAVLNKWKISTYTGDDLFSGCSGYDYIQSHLGYRYHLLSSKLKFHPLWSERATLYFTIENSGFSPAYKRFAVTIHLLNQETNETTDLETRLDIRAVPSGSSCTLQTELDLRSMAKGTYSLSLSLQDSYTESYIHFANEGYEASDSVPLGTLVLR